MSGARETMGDGMHIGLKVGLLAGVGIAGVATIAALTRGGGGADAPDPSPLPISVGPDGLRAENLANQSATLGAATLVALHDRNNDGLVSVPTKREHATARWVNAPETMRTQGYGAAQYIDLTNTFRAADRLDPNTSDGKVDTTELAALVAQRYGDTLDVHEAEKLVGHPFVGGFEKMITS